MVTPFLLVTDSFLVHAHECWRRETATRTMVFQNFEVSVMSLRLKFVQELRLIEIVQRVLARVLTTLIRVLSLGSCCHRVTSFSWLFWRLIEEEALGLDSRLEPILFVDLLGWLASRVPLHSGSTRHWFSVSRHPWAWPPQQTGYEHILSWVSHLNHL